MNIEVFCDGASRGQGQKKIGEAACAAVVYKNRKKVAQFARGLGKRSNNEAEYEAVIAALLICSMSDFLDPIIYTDSAVVANQISGKWKCKNDDLVPLLMTIEDIRQEYKFRVLQVPRNLVWEPDSLANEFLDQLEIRKKESWYNRGNMKRQYDQDHPIVLGLAGKAATGKTAVAESIVPKASFGNTNSGIVWDHIFFAMPLYEFYSIRSIIEGQNAESRKLFAIHHALFDLYGNSSLGSMPPYKEFTDLVHKINNERLDFDGSKPRSFLQKVGDYCREYDESCFAKWGTRKALSIHNKYLTSLDNDEEEMPHCVIVSDVRFLNEAEAILKQPNGIIIKFEASDEVRRNRIFARDSVFMTDEQMSHRSEKEIDMMSDLVDVTIDSSDIKIEEQVNLTIKAVKESFGL